MTTDKSPDFVETEAFLERRLEESSSLGSALRDSGEWLGVQAMGMVNGLRSKGVRIWSVLGLISLNITTPEALGRWRLHSHPVLYKASTQVTTCQEDWYHIRSTAEQYGKLWEQHW